MREPTKPDYIERRVGRKRHGTFVYPALQTSPNDIAAGGLESARQVLFGKKAHIRPRSV
jgi:hypothetical protein